MRGNITPSDSATSRINNAISAVPPYIQTVHQAGQIVVNRETTNNIVTISNPEMGEIRAKILQASDTEVRQAHATTKRFTYNKQIKAIEFNQSSLDPRNYGSYASAEIMKELAVTQDVELFYGTGDNFGIKTNPNTLLKGVLSPLTQSELKDMIIASVTAVKAAVRGQGYGIRIVMSEDVFNFLNVNADVLNGTYLKALASSSQGNVVKVDNFVIPSESFYFVSHYNANTIYNGGLPKVGKAYTSLNGLTKSILFMSSSTAIDVKVKGAIEFANITLP